jgi:hypothetical protein
MVRASTDIDFNCEGADVATFQERRIPQLFERITAEYLEMPGLSLTKPQMQRLWSMEAVVCDALVDALVDAHVLWKTPKGTYVSIGSGA